MVRVLKSNSTTKNQKHTECHETRENNEPTWKNRIHRMAVEFTSTFVGQAMMMQSDKLLWTLEKTATWISNGKTDGKRAKAPASLVRPLNWFFFLPTLVALRFIRVMLSLVSICLGFDEIEASTMVTFLHESRRNIRQVLLEAKHRNKRRHSVIYDYVKQQVLSFLTSLSALISQTSDTNKVHNKTSLNASVTFAMENDEKIVMNSDDSDLEDQLYKDFLARPTIETSDEDDEDFVYESNGDDISDTDSQSSVDTEDLSDVDDDDDDDDDAINEEATNEVISSEPKHTNGNAADNGSNNSNYLADTSTDQPEIAKLDSHDAQSSTCSNANDTQNKLIEDTATATEAKGVPSHNRGKNANRNHKNGRNNAKAQNNGKHFNGAHAQAKSKTTKQHHVESTVDFIAEAAAADRT